MEDLQGVSKTFRALIYKAHRAVIFAIAQLDCFDCSKNGCGYNMRRSYTRGERCSHYVMTYRSMSLDTLSYIH